MLKRKPAGNAVQASRRHAGKSRHRAVHAIAKSLSRRIQIVKSPPRHRIFQVDHRRCFAGNPIAFGPVVDRSTGFSNHASEFVTEHDRIIHRPTVRCRPLMQVAPAHPNRGDLNQHIGWPDLRSRYLAEFDATRLGREIDDGGGLTHTGTSP